MCYVVHSVLSCLVYFSLIREVRAFSFNLFVFHANQISMCLDPHLN